MYKNVVILCVDSLRADGTNYTYKKIHGIDASLKTPHLDSVLSAGSIYKTYSTNTYTTASHASLFTGKNPYDHGIRAFFDAQQKVSPDTITLASELGKEGFQTFFYSDVPELFSSMNIWQGFKVKTYERMNWLWSSIEELQKDRNFIFMHVFDVHEPYLYVEDQSEKPSINEIFYDMIADFRKKLNHSSEINQKEKPHTAWKELRGFMREHSLNEVPFLYPLYTQGLEYFDKYRFPSIMNKLEATGISMNSETLFILISDHGEGKNEFNSDIHFGHAGDVTEDTLRIMHFWNKKQKYGPEKPQSIRHIKESILSEVRGNSVSHEECIIDGKRYIYAESHRTQTSVGPIGLTDGDGAFAAISNKSVTFESTILNRALIADTYKILLNAQPELLKSEETLSNESYIKMLYKCFLGRMADDIGYKNYMKFMEKQHMSRTDLKEFFISSHEFIVKPFIQEFSTQELTESPILLKKGNHVSEINFLLSLMGSSNIAYEDLLGYMPARQFGKIGDKLQILHKKFTARRKK